MEGNGTVTAENNKFRSGYLNSLVSEFYKAKSRTELHQNTLNLVKKNYAGDKLQEMTAEENRQYMAGIDQILLDIDSLAGREQERLENEKRNEVTGNAGEEISIIARIDSISDIVSEEELQIMADAYKDFPLVQRKLSRVAASREFGIDLYPGYDRKIEAASQSAADIKDFIRSRDFGLTPAVYIKMQLGEADSVLSPTVREADET